MTQITQSANLIENWIDNAAVKSIGSGVFPVVHPNTHAIPHSVVSASDSDIDNALHSSLTAFKSWKNTTHDERRDVLLRAAAILKSRSGEMYEAYASELDVDHHFVEFLVSITSSMMETAASLIIPALTGECPPTKRANVALYFCEREPLGVCLALAPWNAAPNLSIRAIINPLAAGNTVIFKTSDITPKTHFLWGDIFREAGLPDGCLNILHSSRENAPSVTQKLIADDRVRHVSFTGSTSVGKEIGKFAGHHLKPCLLELGGKCPVLVLDDADLDKVVQQSFFHAWVNAGQICMATERVIAGTSTYDKLIQTYKANAPPNTSSSVAMAGSFTRIVGMVDDALVKGAKVLVGSWPPSPEDVERCKIPNILLTDATPEMSIWDQETFGPIALILKACENEENGKSEDDAIVRAANASRYGLAASIYSTNITRMLKLAKELQVGLVRINEGTIGDEAVCPFGGCKDTGFGRFNGVEGIREFTQIKTYSIALLMFIMQQRQLQMQQAAGVGVGVGVGSQQQQQSQQPPQPPQQAHTPRTPHTPHTPHTPQQLNHQLPQPSTHTPTAPTIPFKISPQEFYKTLAELMIRRNTPIPPNILTWPPHPNGGKGEVVLGGKTVDLYKIFGVVVQLGGSGKLQREQQWDKVLQILQVPAQFNGVNMNGVG
ncbi:hypothetical protein E3P86_04036 [Wallemia ichthyophaga]|uniref:ARID domain-containing protein n=1 Tax=Wallemia ichthyophaga TaxID=245174 RepID=A0A4T0ILG8_WALIC|nr:hypothetical protein E3P86_04036 [Wallemia ichthyophaga]